MKIGLVSYHSFFQPGGVKRHVLALKEEFQKRGSPSKIIVPRRSKSEKYEKDIILLGKSWPIPFNGTQSDFSISLAPEKVKRLLKKEGFDVLHFHNFGPFSYQILSESNSLNILTLHANLQGTYFSKFFPFLINIFKKIIKEKIDGLIGIAPFNLTIFKNFLGPKVVISNGIDLQKFNPKVPKIKKYQNDKFNILFVGRIEKRKGLIYLLKAFKILKKRFLNLRLIVVGEGVLKKESENWVKENNLKDVVFEGKVEGRKLSSYYTSADLFVAPATHGESFGIILLEAMASGCPVVAFANEGYKRVLKGKGSKFLVRPRDWRGLVQKIEILIKNKNSRAEMRNWGIAEAQKYSWSIIADQILDFYKLCLKRKQSLD